ncbi:hypothetical protein Ahy_B04g071278 isoform A [Arachis hypogaea]|uniref:Uncharacterized protein n=1 Tax=Arachis hypogaea TaxID=3818 RepID=A0A444ZKD8_ARAHY|nr:hypothetical protein Ahy_B04g071278 isoform A [Arachis hypogaea]
MSLPHSYSVLTLFFGGGTSTINKHSLMLKAKENPFLYDIVANGRNRIDVDKFDYIVRYCRACGLGCNFQPERQCKSLMMKCYRVKDC